METCQEIITPRVGSKKNRAVPAGVGVRCLRQDLRLVPHTVRRVKDNAANKTDPPLSDLIILGETDGKE